MDNLVASTIYKSLINFGEQTFSKSDGNQASINAENIIKENVLKDTKIGDVLFFNILNGQFIINSDDTFTYQWKCKLKGIDVDPIAYCCATSDQTPDGLPRFAAIQKRSYGCWWDLDYKHIEELYNTNQESFTFLGNYTDFNGWDNTLVLLKYNVNIANICKNINKYCYVPALHELSLMYDNKICTQEGNKYWSSTISNDGLVHILMTESNEKRLSVYRKIDMCSLLPFVYVNTHNISIIDPLKKEE